MSIRLAKTVNFPAFCVRDRSPKGREGRSYPTLGPLGGGTVAPEQVRGKVRATVPCRESPPLRSRERPYPFIASIKSKPSLTSGRAPYFFVEVVLFENPVPADLAEFALVAHLDFAKPL